MTNRFVAYLAEDITVDYSTADYTAGILGTVKSDHPPLLEADDLATLEEKAYSHLGRHCEDSLYLVDAQGRIRRILINKTHHCAMSRQAKSHFMAWSLLVLCITTFIGTILVEFGGYGLLVLLGISTLYICIVLLKIMNEVEGALVCEILLLLSFLLIPAIKKSHTNHQKRQDTQKNEEPNLGSRATTK